MNIPDEFDEDFSTMTQEEVGAFVLLLKHQFNHGSIPVQVSRQKLLARGPVPEDVLSKFHMTPDGRLINDLMEAERQKSIRYREMQQEKGRLSGAARRLTAVQPVYAFPTLAEVKAAGEIHGVPAAECEAFWHHFESSGWVDKNGNEIVNWQSKLQSWHLSEVNRAGERAHHTSGNSSTPPLRINELRQVMEAKEREAQNLRHRYANEGPMGDTWKEQAKRIEYLKLRKEIKALNTRIATAA